MADIEVACRCGHGGMFHHKGGLCSNSHKCGCRAYVSVSPVVRKPVEVGPYEVAAVNGWLFYNCTPYKGDVDPTRMRMHVVVADGEFKPFVDPTDAVREASRFLAQAGVVRSAPHDALADVGVSIDKALKAMAETMKPGLTSLGETMRQLSAAMTQVKVPTRRGLPPSNLPKRKVAVPPAITAATERKVTTSGRCASKWRRDGSWHHCALPGEHGGDHIPKATKHDTRCGAFHGNVATQCELVEAHPGEHRSGVLNPKTATVWAGLPVTSPCLVSGCIKPFRHTGPHELNVLTCASQYRTNAGWHRCTDMPGHGGMHRDMSDFFARVQWASHDAMIRCVVWSDGGDRCHGTAGHIRVEPHYAWAKGEKVVWTNSCTCTPYPYGTGPEIDCPVHGDPSYR